MSKSLIVNCFFCKHPEKIGAALGFKKQAQEIKQVALTKFPKAVMLVESRYGYFWFTSNEGFMFEICRDNLSLGIDSLEEPLRKFVPLCANKILYLHYHTGTKYSSLLVDNKLTALRLRLVEEGYRVSVLA